MNVRSFLKFLFFHLPRILFQVAGLFRAINRGKRAFREGLESEGLPKELVEELLGEFDPLEGFDLREALGFFRGEKQGLTCFSTPLSGDHRKCTPPAGKGPN
ncbi:hypothetical protein [Thermococcus waiotapuensis]|uniref:Uncharacterized protein n=1 Tax=Thermococcus waiotapuensis TaxID=90909 RepID=A0AAE4NVG6_9EURY|nr:hypothetical protein [Thermococcus waiotapuensis]MDV3103381.1 hypothetical protein [Thermococcus waiotapuensis]